VQRYDARCAAVVSIEDVPVITFFTRIEDTVSTEASNRRKVGCRREEWNVDFERNGNAQFGRRVRCGRRNRFGAWRKKNVTATPLVRTRRDARPPARSGDHRSKVIHLGFTLFTTVGAHNSIAAEVWLAPL
jgi:hypothetical protein